MSSEEKKKGDFEWSGDAGDGYAEWNPSDVAGTDKMHEDFFGMKASELLKRAVEKAAAEGLALETAKVLDVGCNTGGLLEIMEKVCGFRASNLHGVDLSPKAIEINAKAHPQYNLKVVKGLDYDVPEVDFVYHSGVLCQIQDTEYDAFFSRIRATKAKFYMLMEGINPRGYEKIANSEAHGHHGHGGHDEDKVAAPMDEGFHYTDDHAKVAEAHFPKARKIFSERVEYKEESKQWFEALHMEYTLCNVYMLE